MDSSFSSLSKAIIPLLIELAIKLVALNVLFIVLLINEYEPSIVPSIPSKGPLNIPLIGLVKKSLKPFLILKIKLFGFPKTSVLKNKENIFGNNKL